MNLASSASFTAAGYMMIDRLVPLAVLRSVSSGTLAALLILTPLVTTGLLTGTTATAHAEAACDSDGDGSCDAVDPCPDDGNDDRDGDGICEGQGFNAPMNGDGDNCPTVPNSNQANLDGDDRGDACDLCPGVSGAAEDACLGTGVWETRAPNNESRSESGLVAAGGKIYLIAGEQTVAGTSVEVYDPATNTWSNGPALPQRYHHVQPVAVGNRIYLPGGLFGFPGPSYDTMLMLDTNNPGAGWQSMAPMNTTRGAHGCAVKGVRIYCAGGLSSSAGNTAIGSMEVYNTVDDAWTTLAPMPRPRDHFDPLIIDGKLYAIAGRDTAINSTYPHNDIYHIATNTWSLGAPIPTARGGYGADVLQGRIVIVSGEGGGPDNGTFPQVQEYDPVRDVWRSLADVPTSRHGFGGAVVGLENAAPVLHTVSGGWKQGFAHTTVHEVFRYDVCNASGECDDGNPCTVDSCNATGNCQNVPVGNGAACNDGLACTTDDQCNDGHCTGASTCAAGQFCSSSTGQCANPELVCIATGNDPDALFQGSMTKGPEFTGGADLDTAADSLTCPILYPDSTQSSPGGGSGDRVRFDVVLPTGGDWGVWGRFYYPGAPGSNDSNSFFITLDGGPLRKFGNNKDFFRKWHFDGDGAVETGPPAPLVYGLSAGPHTFTVEKREAGSGGSPRIDVICFDQDASSPPTDEEVCLSMGGCPDSCSLATTTTMSLATTSTMSVVTTTMMMTTTTLAPGGSDLLCWPAAAGAPGSLAGNMKTSTALTGGADADPVADNLTSPLLYADSQQNSPGGGSGDEVSYTVAIPASGNWYLWARMYYPGAAGSNDANSFLASVDGGSRKKLGNNRDYFRTWHFDGNGSVESGAPAPLLLGNLSAGLHALTIEKREATPGGAPRLDVLCITRDPSLVPTDGAACANGAGCAGPTTTLPPVSTTTLPSGPTTTMGVTTTTMMPAGGGPICLRAGAPDTLSGSMTADTQYTGGADLDPAADNLTTPLLYADSTQNAFGGGSGDLATYDFQLPSTGPWYLWGRLYYPGAPGSNDANSFFVKIDGGPLLKLGNKNSYFRTWHFDGDGNVGNGAPVALSLGTLAAGAHTLRVEKREVSPVPPRLDVICLTETPVPPTDGEACASLGTCGATTTLPPASTTTMRIGPSTTLVTPSTTSTTIPGPSTGLFCIDAGSDPTAVFEGAMTADAQFANGADLDPAANSLTGALAWANSATSSFSGNSTDLVSYLVDFPVTANWYFWGRFYYPSAPGSNGPNSFFIQIDGGNRMKAGNNKELFRTWHFDGDGSVEIGSPIGLDLGIVTAGTHTVILAKREVASGVQPRADVLCFAQDGIVAPAATAACEALPGCSP